MKDRVDEDHAVSNRSIDVEHITSMFRNWAETGHPQGQADLQKAAYIDEIYKSNMSTLTRSEDIRELPLMAAHLRKSLDGICPILINFSNAIAWESELAIRRVKDVTLMCGVAILPDDLLAYIMELVRERGGEREDKSALTLSHVCRRFRSVALATYSLWSSIRGTTDLRTTTTTRNTTYLERSGLYPLEITFCMYSKKNINAKLCRFMETVLPHAARWRRFKVELHGGIAGTQRFFSALAKLGTIYLPRLEHLAIVTKFEPTSILEIDPDPFLHWTIPSLLSVELDDVEIDLHRYSSLTDVSFTAHEEQLSLSWLFDRLKSLQTLRSLHLGFHSSIIHMSPSAAAIASVSHLSFDIALMDNVFRGENRVLSMLSCPNVTDLRISLDLDSLFKTRPVELGRTAIGDLIRGYFAQIFNESELRYRRLTHLHLKVAAPIMHGSDGYDGFGHATNEIPLEDLPSLKVLTLEGSMWGPRDSVAFGMRETSRKFPALEIITIRSARPDKLHDWLRSFMWELMDQGDWSCFKQLVLRGASDNERDAMAIPRIIPRDEFDEWLGSISNEIHVDRVFSYYDTPATRT